MAKELRTKLGDMVHAELAKKAEHWGLSVPEYSRHVLLNHLRETKKEETVIDKPVFRPLGA